MAKRYDADAANLRDKYQVDLDAMQKSMHATLRSEFELEKRRLEQDMIAARDAKIELIIDKLQAETQRKVEAAEKRLRLHFEAETKVCATCPNGQSVVSTHHARNMKRNCAQPPTWKWLGWTRTVISLTSAPS